MADTKVETIARLAQWKIESFGPTTPYKRSDPFKIGIWNWHLSVEKNRSVYIRLFPEASRISKEQPPLARFVIRVSTSAPNRRPYISPKLAFENDKTTEENQILGEEMAKLLNCCDHPW